LPGSSIARVYEEAEATQADVIRQAREVAADAAKALTKPADAVTVLNSLNWERAALVALPEGWTCASDAQGRCLPQQTVDGRKVVEAAVPSCGWTSLKACGPKCKPAPAGSGRAQATVKGGKAVLENDLLRVEFSAAGEITRIFDKEAQRELAAGPCNAFRLFKDVPANYDGWDIDSMYALTPVDLEAKAAVTVVAAGPLVASVGIRRRVNGSDLVQDVRLRRGSRRVDFVTTVEWRESHKMLKVAFPVNVFANEAIHEIQFGHIRRPNHQSRPFDADRFEVAQQKWTALAEENRGFAVLNDSKYGVNVLGNTINLTLLRSPMGPDMNADKGTQTFTYAFYPWNGSLAESGVVREGYDLNVPVLTVGGAAKTVSLLSVDAPNIVVEAVKPAEDGSGDVVVRLYESKRMATRATLTTSLKVRSASEATMLEKPQSPLAVKGGKMALEFRPFEIKTVRMKG
ncbi:MAG: alpha-mannosidase, partial [Planctomycetes bacterium]|nr:alpha-mannosidase [Planctomycetota bacterium]